MSEYIKKDAAIDFCDKVLNRDAMLESDVAKAFQAYKAYLESLATIEATACRECMYVDRVTTPVATTRYACILNNGWKDEQGCCMHGREVGFYDGH